MRGAFVVIRMYDLTIPAGQMLSRKPALPVLVVGGGIAGLSAALFLAVQNVPVILIDNQDKGNATPPTFRLTQRTMELLHSAGISGDLPEAHPDFRLRRARVRSLAGEWFEKLEPEKEWDQSYSPCKMSNIAHDALQRILRTRILTLGVDVRVRCELQSFVQSDTSVRALVHPLWGPENALGSYIVEAAYMIAADGSHSPVREALKIERHGRGPMHRIWSVIFRAPLQQYLRDGVTQFEIEQPNLKAFLGNYQDGRWVMVFKDGIKRSEATLKAAIKLAVGRGDFDIEIINTIPLDLEALVADKFSEDRIFLVGESAHVLPPSRSGFAKNEGISDAHNLAWKLAAVLRGDAAGTLLDSYGAERIPVAWCLHDQLFVRPEYASHAGTYEVKQQLIDEEAIEFGALYCSNAVVGTTPTLPPALRPDEWAGQPGTRAPHVWVTYRNQLVSTIDLFKSKWSLLAMDVEWPEIQRVQCLFAGIDFVCDQAELRKAFGLGRSGAVLVRPDGVIAARFADLPHVPSDALRETLMTILGRNDALHVDLPEQGS